MLAKKKILLGVTGGIAAYKSCEILRLYQKLGADVRVVMTPNATKFITPLTLEALSHHKVELSLFEDCNAISHIELGKWADLFVIAPATANTIAKLANGIADNLLTNVALACNCPILVAPAMNVNMYQNAVTQSNLNTLHQIGINIVEPENGIQACGDVGKGRMAEPTKIVDESLKYLFPTNGKKIVITAGPTIEPIDPVRYITNKSSGKMGLSLAIASFIRGNDVTLIMGPTNLQIPSFIKTINVKSAQEMLEVSLKETDESCIFISCAAVCDYKLKHINKQKIKKQLSDTNLTLDLIENPDIVKTVAQSKKTFTIGFAAETNNVIEYAKSKITKKNLDMIIANDVSDQSIGFGSDNNKVSLIYRNGTIEELPIMTKQDLAMVLIDKISKYHGETNNE